MACNGKGIPNVSELHVRRRADRVRDLRPGAVDTNDPTRLETVGVGVLDVGDVPPYLLDRGERGRCSAEEGDGRPLHVLYKPLVTEVKVSTALGKARCWTRESGGGN